MSRNQSNPKKQIPMFQIPMFNYKAMIEKIRQRLKLTTLKYQKLEDLVEAIGLPKEKLCTYCWDGALIE